MQPKILVLNGSLGGRDGNTSQVLSRLVTELEGRASVEAIHLAERLGPRSKPAIDDAMVEQLKSADGFVFATGTYWDSWGSPLQAFLESTTHLEAGDAWLGKPAAFVVTMHSVGGKEVLSRLQGVATTLGMAVPPMTGFVYSLANHLALSTASNPFHADLFQLSDLRVVASNLVEALRVRSASGASWTTWPVDDGDPGRRWL